MNNHYHIERHFTNEAITYIHIYLVNSQLVE